MPSLPFAFPFAATHAVKPPAGQRRLRLGRGARLGVRHVQRLWRRCGLAARMLLLVLGLLVLTQAVVLWTFEQRVEHQALQQVQHELLTAERVWLRMAAEQTRVLREGARQLGSDQAFVQAQRGNDQPALVLALERVDARHGARLGAVLDASGRVRATRPLDALFMLWLQTASYPQMGLPGLHGDDAVVGALEQVAQHLLRLPERSGMGVVAGAPFQFVLVPTAQPGWLLLGAPIDQALVADMTTLLSVDMGVVVRQADNDAAAVVATTLDRQHDAQLLGAAALAGSPAPSLSLAQGEHAVRLLSLVAQGGQIDILLMRSLTSAAAPYQRLWWALAGLSLLGALLFATATSRLLRRVVHPLDTLDQAAQALRQGRFDAPVDTASASPEVARAVAQLCAHAPQPGQPAGGHDAHGV